MALTQKNRLLNLSTALGTDVLFLTSFSGTEEMSKLFSYQLELISDNANIMPQELVGTPVSWSIQVKEGERRHWHGYVKQLVRGDVNEDQRRDYRIEVVPWFWFLSQTSDCKIFQEMTVPDIIEEVFSDYGFAEFETDFQATHKDWEYCVQYRETDFNFVSRLMEQEGITYYFKHEDGKHTLVLTDHANGSYMLPESEVDLPSDISGVAIKDHLTSWERSYHFVPGKTAQRDYNFKTPSSDLQTNANSVVNLPNIQSYELFDYPGEYEETGIGNDETRMRIEEEETRHELVHASSLCRTFQVGGKFKVGKHLDENEEGTEVMITYIHHTGNESMGYESGAHYGDEDYRNTFMCIPSNRVYRPARETRKPVINGIQTAVVTGPAGEEIYCDEYGRVKVQFYWDRLGKRDEKSSCWIRTAHNVAGCHYGFIALPRIGQEVVVNFLEGDPDRPLIVAGVYNAEQMPHYELPSEKTKTYIKTNSSLGGDGFNELMFEDKNDDERIFIHAQKNMDTRVLNDSKERIFGHRHQIIGWEKDGKKDGDQRERVYGDKHLNVKGNQVEHIEGNFQLMVGNGEADDGGNVDFVCEKKRTDWVQGDHDAKVDGDYKEEVGGNLHQTTGGNHHHKVAGNVAVEAGSVGEVHIKAGMKVVIEAGVQLSLVGPGGFVDIGPTGVTIQGMMVNINSGGAKGSGGGCKPQSPKDAEKAEPAEPALAHNSTSGQKSAPG